MSACPRSIPRPQRRLCGGEEGFTLVELVVAIGVMFASLTALAYTTTVAFADIGTARQRQAANGLLNRTMEQVRALPFDTLKAGVNNADAGADPANIAISGSTYTYRANGEEMPHGNLPAPVTPLYPHVRNGVKVGTTTYRVAVYPTFLPGSDKTAFRVTVVVTWPKLVRGGRAGRVAGQTIVYSPTGCLSTATHPFAAPCQAFSYAAAAVQSGGVKITGTIRGIDLTRAGFHLAESASTMQLEQVSAVQGYAQASGSTLELAGLADQSSGLEQLSTRANSDATQAAGTYDAKTYTAPSSPRPLSVTGSDNLLELTSSGTGDTASSVSTTNATVANVCREPAGAGQVDGQPCGDGRALQGSTLGVALTLWEAVQLGLGVASLGEVRAPPVETVSYTNRDLAPGTTGCTTTGGDGCVRAESRRAIGRVRVGGLPTGMTPDEDVVGAWLLGCRCLLELTNYSDRVVAEAGGGSAAPSVTVLPAQADLSATPVLRYWNGSGYSTVTAFGGAPQQLPVRSVTSTVGSFVVTIGAEVVRTGGTSATGTTTAASSACPATCRTQGDALANSPLIADISYRATTGTTSLADLRITVDLGPALAKVSYQGAPSG